MANAPEHPKPRKGRTDVRKAIVKTLKEYASVSTIHGPSYIAGHEQSLLERILWLVVVCLALAFTTYQVPKMYHEWQENPVVTTLDTVALPIEDIEFPAVTICPQGSAKNILDAVLFKQLKEYILNKRNSSSKNDKIGRKKREAPRNITSDEIRNEIKLFLEEVYPGAKNKPTQLVQMMTSENPDKTLQSMGVMAHELEEDCDESAYDNVATTLNSQTNMECPDGFEALEDKSCIHKADISATYEGAKYYCETKTFGLGGLLRLETEGAIKAFNDLVKGQEGKEEKKEGMQHILRH